MRAPPLPHIEAKRLESLWNSKLLDTPQEERFDRITRTASRLFRVPIAVVSLVDKDRQWLNQWWGFPYGKPHEKSLSAATQFSSGRFLWWKTRLKTPGSKTTLWSSTHPTSASTQAAQFTMLMAFPLEPYASSIPSPENSVVKIGQPFLTWVQWLNRKSPSAYWRRRTNCSMLRQISWGCPETTDALK